MNFVLSPLRRHWFYFTIPFFLAIDLYSRLKFSWGENPRLGEIIVLCDWCILVPILYVICYRALTNRALVIRTIAISCGGLWIAHKIIPITNGTIIARLYWIRIVGTVAVAIAEGVALVAALRVMFGREPDQDKLALSGVPPFMVKLMLAEARFWRWVWSKLRGPT